MGESLSDEMKADESRAQLLLVLLKEQGDELRYRSQPELLYTAAAVGSFGAVTWGVAALPVTNFPDRFITHPAAIAAMGVLLVASVLIAKACRDHIKHAYAKEARADICRQIASLPNCGGIIPDALMVKELGPGYRGSVLLVGAAATSSIVFCIGTLASNWCYIAASAGGCLFVFTVTYFLAKTVKPPSRPVLKELV